MPTQKKSLVVILRDSDALFFVVNETDFNQIQLIPLALLSRALRTFALRHRAIRDVYLIIDDIPVYHSLLTEVQRQKDELLQLWNCEGPLAYRELRRDNKYLYMGYSYTPIILQKYINILKKTGLSCQGIIPADFLYQGGPLQIVQSNHRLRMRLFDGQGGIFAALLLRATTDQRDVAQIGQYAVREKILLPEAMQETTELYVPELMVQNFYERLQPSIILYTQGAQHPHTPLRLNTLQKTILVFIAVLLIFIAMVFIWSGYKMAKIRHDILFIKRQTEQLLPQVKKLRDLEVKTLWLKRLGPKVNPELVQLFGFIHQSQGLISELTYVPERKLLSVVVLDSTDGRNAVLKSCQRSPYFSAVNLIYIRPQGRYLEYKLILTVR